MGLGQLQVGYLICGPFCEGVSSSIVVVAGERGTAGDGALAAREGSGTRAVAASAAAPVPGGLNPEASVVLSLLEVP